MPFFVSVYAAMPPDAPEPMMRTSQVCVDISENLFD
jgi:hypothetical protein